MRYCRLALVLILAMAAPALAGEDRTGAATEVKQAVELRITISGQEIRAIAPPGEPVRIEDQNHGVTLELVPAIQPAPGLSPPRIGLEVYDVVRLGGGERPNLVESVLLPEAGSMTVFGSRQAVEVEAIGVRSIERELVSHGPGQDLRPVNCCVVCDGVMACGMCVSMDCGSCCSH